MLAGLQNMSFIPGTDIRSFVPGMAPSYDDVLAGRDLVKYNRIPVKVSAFHAEVFNMMDKDDRSRYESRMKELMEGTQLSTKVVWKNDLQVMSVGGNQRWMRYLEWAEYEINDVLSQGPSGSGSGASTSSSPSPSVSSATPRGVFSEVGEDNG